MMKLMRLLWILLMISCLVAGGCSWFKPSDDKPAQELVSEGMDEYRTGNYRRSIELFEKLKDWYPFSKYAILAELKIGDAYYYLQEYDEAIAAYEQFESLHPRNEAVPYVIYQIGRCYFDRIDTIDRDQSFALKGADVFDRLVKEHPDTSYAKKAREHIKFCLKSMAGNEFYVGLFYYKTKRYKAALHRFQTIIEKYPDVGVHRDALHYIALCRAALSEEKPKK